MLQMVMSRHSVEKCLSHRTENVYRGTFLCCVSESFLYRINLWMRSGVVSNFSVEFFCRTVSKNAVEEPFSLSLISGIEKVRKRELGGKGGVSRFSVQIVLSHSAEKF